MRFARETIFQVRCETSFGVEVRVVGSSESLGRWDPTRAFRLQTNAKLYPTWRSRASTLLDEGVVEYKYVLVTLGTEVVLWESGPNRQLPAIEHEAEDCHAVLVQEVFGQGTLSRLVRLSPFPEPRAFSHLRKARQQYATCGQRRGSAAAWYEDPTGSLKLEDDLSPKGLVLSPSGLTRASSTDSVSYLEAEEEPVSGRRTLLVWPQTANNPSPICCVEVFGSFTQPPWAVPINLHLCPRTGLWWVAVEEALPHLQPGTYDFKFLINGEAWLTNPALPVSKGPDGSENNKLRIDFRLVNRIVKRKARSPDRKGTRVSFTDGDSPSTAEDSYEESSHSAQDTDQAKKGGLTRRVLSTADRLCRTGSDAHSGPGGQPRTISSPLLLGNPQSGTDAALFFEAGMCDSSGLYNLDVALLLELPDLKRNVDLTLTASAFSRPKDGTDGEDSHFLAAPALGVADGVGGLQPVLGYTSKAFADELMEGCKEAVQALTASDALGPQGTPSATAEMILVEGFGKVLKNGASTAVITYMDRRTSRLGIACLGDSGVMVVRKPTNRGHEDRLGASRSTVVFKSPPQQHDFNYPYQLCRLPQELAKMLTRNPDQPTDCVCFDVEVEEGDMVLVYSDGVDDNLYDQEILDICDRALSPYAVHVLGLPPQAATSPSVIARAVGSAAYARSQDEKARTPFAEEARKAGWPLAWSIGGKEDDITCIAAWVTHCPTK